MAQVLTSGVSTPRPQLAQTAAGVLAENASPEVLNGTTALATQKVYGSLLGLRGGDSVTGVLMLNELAASGTLPTTVRVGIADATGKMLALSGNLNALASFPLGVCLLPFTAQFTVPTDGGYFACIVKNGVYGTNEPVLLRNAVAQGSALTARATFAPRTFLWAAQTDLPAVNSSVTITTATDVGYYMAFYV